MILDKVLTSPNDVLHKVLDSIDEQKSLLLTYLNQHCFNIYSSNVYYRKLLDTKFDIYQADLGVFLALKIFFSKKINRIDATAMNKVILEELIRGNIPLVIVGGIFDKKFVQDETKKRGINLVAYNTGYFEEIQTDSIITELSKINTRIFIVGMGVPQQELFADKLSQTSGPKVIICVGNFLEFYFGTKKRAPVFIQKIGMEWMFRLITEPGRLWNRYLIGIPLFIFRILKLKFEGKIA
jgi:N-acetylglucosaminyldiphosphoundecaprenol N-acetyl-beta-D-mannosaminyltransferase